MNFSFNYHKQRVDINGFAQVGDPIKVMKTHASLKDKLTELENTFSTEPWFRLDLHDKSYLIRRDLGLYTFMEFKTTDLDEFLRQIYQKMIIKDKKKISEDQKSMDTRVTKHHRVSELGKKFGVF